MYNLHDFVGLSMPPPKCYKQSPPAMAQRTPRKKALLIGINYTVESQPEETTASVSESELTGPHKDILAMRQLLMGTS